MKTKIVLWMVFCATAVFALEVPVQCLENSPLTDVSGLPVWKSDPIFLPSACVGRLYILKTKQIDTEFDCNCTYCPCGCSYAIVSNDWLGVSLEHADLRGTPTASDIGVLKTDISGRNDFGFTNTTFEILVRTCE